MIVLDASALIAYLDGEDAHHSSAEAVLAEAVDDEIGVNVLTLAEVLVVPARTGRLEAVRAALRDMEVEELSFPPNAALSLALLRAHTGLKMPDCCVVLSAMTLEATVVSFDERLARAALDQGLTVRGR